ncbi:acetyl-CoA acetyltransferase [Nocardioides sp. MAH-18]|uniref:Acetyl-CoA acetyltransferase n=1 Tax=Nocardioides agri TaxID=2682843 RepID=A0A6L6XQH5_9ACTN|nr:MULTISPECIES: acetyl-CoA acetyltransferase [unclassified Nocardioides]MBA2954141.1 acetyl-CoA acetyltransferase [Nocardioides sp. CGMCC 1.13656]MVQ49003.1 acetyl-CoA acetyltransferase [Nocardioides sp. MAH-18]
MSPSLDPATPVLVGVGQHSERIDDPGYAGLSAADLAGRAAAAALVDTGADADALAAAIDTVAGVRQFEVSTPIAEAPLGRADNYPRAVARRIGADPGHAMLEVAGGQAPQQLVTEMAAAIAAGSREVVLLVGSEAISTTRHLAERDPRPDFTETVGGQLEDRGLGLRGLVSWQTVIHGLLDAPVQYALFENARRARLGLSREQYAAGMGALFAPFTEVAAANPHAAAPTVRTAAELVTPSERNRAIVDPYPRFLVARDQVNQGAAVLLTSVGAARRLGVPEDRWVFLHGHADVRERDFFERADLSRYPAAGLAVRHALEVAGADLADVTHLDLYSCFPVAVTCVLDELGLPPDDPRGLTLTGGLPFFGGAGNNYSMHAIAEAVARCRADRDALALVGANGGMMSKYSVGLYSARPVAWRPDRSAEVQAEIASWPAPALDPHPEGWASIETCTVRFGRAGRRTAIVVGRLEETGARFMANALEDDDEILDLLEGPEPLGRRIYVRGGTDRHRVTTTRERMDALRPGTGPVDWTEVDQRAAEFESSL